MTPTAQQLHGNWTSECTAPEQVDNLGCTVAIMFDELPFDNYNIARITVTKGKNENILYTGPFKIEPLQDNQFFILMNEDIKMPAAQFNENTFIVDIENYGSMIMMREK